MRFHVAAAVLCALVAFATTTTADDKANVKPIKKKTYGYTFTRGRHDDFRIKYTTVHDPYPCEMIRPDTHVTADFIIYFEDELSPTVVKDYNGTSIFYAGDDDRIPSWIPVYGTLQDTKYSGQEIPTRTPDTVKPLDFVYKDKFREQNPIEPWLENLIERGMKGMCVKEGREIMTMPKEPYGDTPAGVLYDGVLPPVYPDLIDDLKYPESYYDQESVYKYRQTGFFKTYIILTSAESGDVMRLRERLKKELAHHTDEWKKQAAKGDCTHKAIRPASGSQVPVKGKFEMHFAGTGLSLNDEAVMIPKSESCAKADRYMFQILSPSTEVSTHLYSQFYADEAGEYKFCYKHALCNKDKYTEVANFVVRAAERAQSTDAKEDL